MKKMLLVALLFLSFAGLAQHGSSLPADRWVDSVFKTLTEDQKIAQLMVVRLSAIDPATKKITFYNKEVEEYIRKYNVGSICLFQGGPQTQVAFINYFQAIAQTPILICMDAENGVGMRMDSVDPLPRQMMLGAVQDPELIYQYGYTVGQQCLRVGVQLNYAPVVDVNNNPDNPVINDRSFGENQYRVAADGIQYMKGMQDAGVLACAKHFPGHGDVSVDSHYDLPVINKSMKALDTLELYPFKKMFEAGVASVMMAHLYIPAIDKTSNLATSLSANNVTGLLRKKLKYKGLSFTDALEMKGVSKYFPDGAASVQSLIAGNDMLCLPGDVPLSIQKIKEAIAGKKLKWKDLDAHVKKVLLAKYNSGLANFCPVDTSNLLQDLNKDVPDLYRRVAEKALTLLRNENSSMFPLRLNRVKKIAYIGFGMEEDNAFSERMRSDYNANVYYFDYGLDSVKAAAAYELLRNRYDLLIIGLHHFNRYPAGDFGISNASRELINKLDEAPNTISFVFGNPYAVKYACNAKNLVACYDDDEITQSVAADWLNGKFTASGKLPVTVCAGLKFNDGIIGSNYPLPSATAGSLGFKQETLLKIDAICKQAIAEHATPGCVVLVLKDGKLAYEKAFGYLTYTKTEPVYPQTIYDLASVTKVAATTISVMKMLDEGKLDINKSLGDYLPWLRGSNKDSIKIRDVLLHQAGLRSYIPFYEETIVKNKNGAPDPYIYSSLPDSSHRLRVAEKLYIRNDWEDTMYRRIVQSPVAKAGQYTYSDLDFILMGKIVESLTGKPLDEYVKETFYTPLGMMTTGFRPRLNFPLNRIAPTELETAFRRQLIQGDVHDPGAAMFGGVSGHAGLFSDAYDLAILAQLLLNGGTMNGQTFLKKETIDLFTAYHSDVSRRGYGFDKPEKDNATRKEPYPCLSASPATFGHTGFTGTCVWVDPAYNLVYIFLSNRVHPYENNRLSVLNVRNAIMEEIYKAMGK